jgi:hypothetical protein
VAIAKPICIDMMSAAIEIALNTAPTTDPIRIPINSSPAKLMAISPYASDH